MKLFNICYVLHQHVLLQLAAWKKHSQSLTVHKHCCVSTLQPFGAAHVDAAHSNYFYEWQLYTCVHTLLWLINITTNIRISSTVSIISNAQLSLSLPEWSYGGCPLCSHSGLTRSLSLDPILVWNLKSDKSSWEWGVQNENPFGNKRLNSWFFSGHPAGGRSTLEVVNIWGWSTLITASAILYNTYISRALYFRLYQY